MKVLKANAPSQRVQVTFKNSQKRASQEFKEETDINAIVRRFKKTGILGDPAKRALARYGDLTQIPDYHEMLNRVLAAQEGFQALPPEIRAKYDNDPGKLVNGLQTKEGQELAVKLGLAVKREPEANSAQIQPNQDPVSDSPTNSSPKAKKDSKAVAEE